MVLRRSCTAMLVLAGVILQPAAGSAPAPETRRLLGSASAPSRAPHQLVDMWVSVLGAYDDDLRADRGSSGSPSDQPINGGYPGLDWALFVSQQRQRLTLTAQGVVGMRYYGVAGR